MLVGVTGGQAPWAPPIVEMSGGMAGHLLCWERHQVDGSWWAWVSWVQHAGGRHVHKVVTVRASSLRPLEPQMPTGMCRGGSSDGTAVSGQRHPEPHIRAVVPAGGAVNRAGRPRVLSQPGYRRGRATKRRSQFQFRPWRARLFGRELVTVAWAQ
jgi:hypothetical protein